MGTRSDIIVKLKNGKWKRVYCHWDGYLSHNGKMLFEHHNSQKLAEALVKPGDMSSLGEIVGTKHPFDWDRSDDAAKAKWRHMTTYYGRDRGEKDVAGTVGVSLEAVWPAADTWTEFTYVWNGDHWFVGSPDDGIEKLVLLEDALNKHVDVTPNVKAFGMVLGTHKALKDQGA